MSYEHRETNGTRNDSLNMENLVKNREQVLPLRRTFIKRTKSIFSRWMEQLIAMNGRDRTSIRESSSRLMTVRLRSCDVD